MSLPGKPTVTNLTLTSANTEYSYTPPEYTSRVMVQARGDADTKIAFTSGQSGTTYFTIPSGENYYDDSITSVATIYAQSTTAGVVLEILTWSGA